MTQPRPTKFRVEVLPIRVEYIDSPAGDLLKLQLEVRIEAVSQRGSAERISQPQRISPRACPSTPVSEGTPATPLIVTVLFDGEQLVIYPASFSSWTKPEIVKRRVIRRHLAGVVDENCYNST